MQLVLGCLDMNLKKLGVDIVDVPNLNTLASGLVTTSDFEKIIDEEGLKNHLAGKISYSNDEALSNDIKSIKSINIIRNGKKLKRLNRCNSIFVTTNYRLVSKTCEFLSDKEEVPLLMGDLDLTTILWLKNPKRFENFPTLKLLETAQMSLMPTEEIRRGFIKKVNELEKRGNIDGEAATIYRSLVYTAREEIMQLVAANPQNIKDVTSAELEDVTKQHYLGDTYEENMRLKKEKTSLEEELAEIRERLEDKSRNKIESAGRVAETIVMGLFKFIFSILLIVGAYALWRANDRRYYGVMCILMGLLGFADSLSGRLHFINKLARVIGNKARVYMTEAEQESAKG